MRKLKALNLCVITFAFVFVCFSQQITKKPSVNEGEEIIRQARKAIGLDKIGEISSYLLKMKKVILVKNNNYESFEEVGHILPSKIQVIYGRDSPFFSRLTRTWNSEKYKSTYESESSTGQRTIQDITAQENKPLSKAVSDVIGKNTAAALQNARKADPKSIFEESRWTSLFPLILSHPFEKNIEFKYVGKAKSNDKTANVVDVKPANGKLIVSCLIRKLIIC